METNEQFEPVKLAVTIGNKTEVDLIRALEQVVSHFEIVPDMPHGYIRRAVDWLHSKYGTGGRFGG